MPVTHCSHIHTIFICHSSVWDTLFHIIWHAGLITMVFTLLVIFEVGRMVMSHDFLIWHNFSLWGAVLMVSCILLHCSHLMKWSATKYPSGYRRHIDYKLTLFKPKEHMNINFIHAGVDAYHGNCSESQYLQKWNERIRHRVTALVLWVQCILHIA